MKKIASLIILIPFFLMGCDNKVIESSTPSPQTEEESSSDLKAENLTPVMGEIDELEALENESR